MKRNLIVLLTSLAAAGIALGWYAPGFNEDVYVAITRIVTSETRSDDFLPGSDGGWDYGDVTNTITARYGGAPFVFGRPLQIEVLISAPPTNDAWASVALQYVRGTNSGTNAWTTIAARSNALVEIQGVRGCHLGLRWTPPTATSYLVRIYAETTGRLVNATASAMNITANGDGDTWEDAEVVGFLVTSNTRPAVLSGH